MTKRLYRDPIEGKLGGVCAGIAHYFHGEVWIVRLITLLLFALGGTVVVALLYVIGWLVLDKRPLDTMDDDFAVSPMRPSGSMRDRLAELDSDMKKLDERLQRMEMYVTSSSFEVDRAFRQL